MRVRARLQGCEMLRVLYGAAARLLLMHSTRPMPGLSHTDTCRSCLLEVGTDQPAVLLAVQANVEEWSSDDACTFPRVLPMHTDVPTQELLQSLGSEVNTRWHRQGYDDHALAEIGARTLAEHELHKKLTAADLVRCANISPALLPQIDLAGIFGQPPLTMYAAEHFYIHALFWIDAAPAIHSHSFSGAFQVISGASLHVQYGFEASGPERSPLILGELCPRSVEILSRGDVRPILAGSSFIHVTSYLDVPTVTLVVRSITRRSNESAFEFYPPGLAIDSMFESDTSVRRRQLLRMLWGSRDPAYDRELLRLVEYDSLERVFHYLVADAALRGDRRADVYDSVIRKRLGTRSTTFLDAVDQFTEQGVARSLFTQVRDFRLRLFLALGMYAPNLESVRAVLERQYRGEQSSDIVVESAARLAKLFPHLQSQLLDPEEVDNVRVALAHSSGPDDVARVRARLKRSPLMRSLI